MKNRANQILQGLDEALLHAKGQKVLKTITDSQSQKEFDEDSDNPDTIEGKKAKSLQYGKPSKNDPRKKPADPSERKKGSKKNAPDSASKPNPNIKQGKNTTNTLSSMLKDHNAKVEKNGKGFKATMGQLRSVQRRGEGAFSTSHHPSMDRRGWGIARVKAFLYLMYNGRPSNPNYKQDNDLLPKDHPKSNKEKK